MKKKFNSIAILLVFISNLHAQWSEVQVNSTLTQNKTNSTFYKLDIDQLRLRLHSAKIRSRNEAPVTLEIPTENGKIERFAVYSFPVMDASVEEKYNIGSYVGTGIDDPSKSIRFSVAPNSFQSMMFSGGNYIFIDPKKGDKGIYAVHSKSAKDGKDFICSTKENPATAARIQALMDDVKNAAQAGNQKFHTLRLALSVTGEYTTYFGGTAGAIAQINATITRVNAVFEQEFNLHLNVVNAPNLIFTNGATDPYSPASQFCKWNYELMNVLHGGGYGVTDADFDIGHLFGASGGGGNAGCIGCIGSNDVSFTSISASDPDGCGYAFKSPNNYKGSGITSPADNDPTGDNFDIDYVAHEMGHQLGDSHTYSFYEQYLNKEVEPGSGSTIMGYAGITGATTDVQEHSDPYFHSVSIDQVQAVLAATNVDVETAIINNPPLVQAMPTVYTIPKGTAFVLTAVATDPDSDPLTYCWEEIDPCKLVDGVTVSNIGNTTSGATFRSWLPTTSPTRYFPKLSTVLGGSVQNIFDFEAASIKARTTNFRVTVRDNKAAGQAQSAFQNQVIVVGAAAAFTVDATTGAAGTPLNISWAVSGTNVSPYNVTNVKIDYTNDGGTTWNVLKNSTPNSGTANVTFPEAIGASMPYVRVSAIGNVFYAVNKVTLTAALATNETEKSKIQLYPNPAKDVLYVKNVSSKTSYKIYDATGKLAAVGSLSNGLIRVSALPKGVYIITLNIDGKTEQSKFIKE